MNSKQRKTLEAIFNYPASGALEWTDIEKLFLAIGANRQEGRGSRLRFVYNGAIASFHRPHPEREAKPYQIRDAKKFLQSIGVVP